MVRFYVPKIYLGQDWYLMVKKVFFELKI